jgi:hypothetical protein
VCYLLWLERRLFEPDGLLQPTRPPFDTAFFTALNSGAFQIIVSLRCARAVSARVVSVSLIEPVSPER